MRTSEATVKCPYMREVVGDGSRVDREGRAHVTTEAETGTWPGAKELPGLPGAGEAGRAPL